MEFLRRRRGRGAELVAKQCPQPLVHVQSLRRVLAGPKHLHQSAVAGLAVGSALDEDPTGALGGVELGSADPHARLCRELERAEVQLLDPAPETVDPRRVLAGQESSCADVLRDPRRPPRVRPRAPGDRRLGAVDRLRGGFEIDPGIRRERKANAAAPFERHDATELREEGRERGLGAGLCCVRPERLQQLVAHGSALAPRGEVGEQETPLTAWKLVLDPAAFELDRHAAAELDPRRRQGFCKVTARRVPDNPAMAKILIHVTHGPEHPTRAALGFLVGRAAVDAGHDVSFFLAGDAVQLLREAVLDNLAGLGTGSLRDSYEAVVAGGGRFYVSGMSSKVRGFEPDGIAEAAMPDRLVELALEHDRVLTY